MNYCVTFIHVFKSLFVVQKLIMSETTIFDVLPDFFFHMNSVVRQAALEVSTSTISLIVYWHWFLMGRTNHGHKSTEFTFFDSSLLKDKISSKDHNWETNGESNQWHQCPAILKSKLKSILVFVKHSPGMLKEHHGKIKESCFHEILGNDTQEHL